MPCLMLLTDNALFNVLRFAFEGSDVPVSIMKLVLEHGSSYKAFSGQAEVGRLQVSLV